jgi:CheY-like chemotaxis protein
MSEAKPAIAIVDDDESVCRAMSRLLRSLGMDTDTFTSGDEFIKHLETVRAFHPDCVVLDVQMPGMNGLEVQDLLVRSENFLPVIFITAHDEASVRERALRAGAVAFLRSRSMTSCSSKYLMKLSKGTAGVQAKESGRVHGGAGWYGGCASAQDKPPCGIRRTSSFNRRNFDLRMSLRGIGSVTGVSHFESPA